MHHVKQMNKSLE